MINPSDTLLHARSNSPIVNDQEFWGGSQNGQIAHVLCVSSILRITPTATDPRELQGPHRRENRRD